MARKYREYTDTDIIKFVAEVKSLAGLLNKLGLKPAGGNYSNIKKKLKKLKLDCKHWTGQGWNKEERLKDWDKYVRTSAVKKHLIAERGHKCEDCGLTTWRDQKIPLELDHIDGNHTNNSKDNLKLRCCNCHALTPTWRGRNNSSQQIQF